MLLQEAVDAREQDDARHIESNKWIEACGDEEHAEGKAPACSQACSKNLLDSSLIRTRRLSNNLQTAIRLDTENNRRSTGAGNQHIMAQLNSDLTAYTGEVFLAELFH